MIRYYTKPTYKNLPILNTQQNLIESRLKPAYFTLATALQQHGKLLQQHHVLKLPSDYQNELSDSELIAKFFKKLNKTWNTAKRGKLFYVWTKEVEKGKNAHIHIHTFTSDKLCKPRGNTTLINKAWEYALQPQNYRRGLVHCDSAQTVAANDPESIEASFKWLSYICKIRKGTANHGFSTTRTDKSADYVIQRHF